MVVISIVVGVEVETLEVSVGLTGVVFVIKIVVGVVLDMLKVLVGPIVVSSVEMSKLSKRSICIGSDLSEIFI